MSTRTAKRPHLKLVVLAVLVLVTPAFTVIIGPASVPLHDVIGVVLSHIPGLDISITWERNIDAIVWRTRVPRIIAGLGVGALLGVSGVVLQALVRNPLAEPYVLGVSAGASTGAALAMIGFGLTASASVGGFAFAGALLATVVVLALGGGAKSTALHLILAGLAVGFGFQAVTNLIVFSADTPETARAVLFWTLGSLARSLWPKSVAVIVIALVLTLLMMYCGPILDALSMGDRTSLAVGIQPATMRLLLLIPVSAAVAASVSIAGGIGFVGLIIPHLVRSWIGYSHRKLVLGSALGGALFLIWTDTFARLVFAPSEVPIGVVTGILGAPFLLFLIWRMRRQIR